MITGSSTARKPSPSWCGSRSCWKTRRGRCWICKVWLPHGADSSDSRWCSRHACAPLTSCERASPAPGNWPHPIWMGPLGSPFGRGIRIFGGADKLAHHRHAGGVTVAVILLHPEAVQILLTLEGLSLIAGQRGDGGAGRQGCCYE